MGAASAFAPGSVAPAAPTQAPKGSVVAAKGRYASVLESLFGNVDVVAKSMNGLGARQRVIGENIANVDTPKYKRMEVAYEQQLRAALKAEPTDELPMQTTSGRHFSLGPNADGLGGVHATLHQVTDETYRIDGNNVDVDAEMAKLAETNLRYNTMATLARNKFDGLKSMLRDIR